MHNSSSCNLKAISKNSVKNPADFTKNHPDFTNNNFTPETEVQDSWNSDNNISDDNDDDNDLEDIFTMSTSESSNPDEEAQDDYTETESLYCDALSRKASLVIWFHEKTKRVNKQLFLYFQVKNKMTAVCLHL